MPTTPQTLDHLQVRLRRCHLCPGMHGPPVTGQAVVSPLMLIGQAPGNREIELHRPFAWTAGKTLFRWFARIGLEEEPFRQRIYMSAVCRCFPGKNPKGGDRLPNREEIENCRRWLDREMELVQPRLILPVGKLAIGRFLEVARLDTLIGREFHIDYRGHQLDLIPLPHPSGASTWHRTEPGKTLLTRALRLISRHPAWREVARDE